MYSVRDFVFDKYKSVLGPARRYDRDPDQPLLQTIFAASQKTFAFMEKRIV